MNEINQCDGCRRGLPVLANGMHDLTGTDGSYPGEKMFCTKDRYLKVVDIKAAPKAASDLAKNLRELADAAERGDIQDFVGAFLQTGSYEFVYHASYSQSLELATLLQTRCIERFKAK